MDRRVRITVFRERVPRVFVVLALLGLVAQTGGLHAHALAAAPPAGEGHVLEAADGLESLGSASHDPSRCHLCRNAKSDRVFLRGSRGPAGVPLAMTRLSEPEPGSLASARLLASDAPRGPPARS